MEVEWEEHVKRLETSFESVAFCAPSGEALAKSAGWNLTEAEVDVVLKIINGESNHTVFFTNNGATQWVLVVNDTDDEYLYARGNAGTSTGLIVFGVNHKMHLFGIHNEFGGAKNLPMGRANVLLGAVADRLKETLGKSSGVKSARK
jgi:hypothetical protein